MALVVAASGGAYVGLFSCGGYIWHEWAILFLMAVLTIGAIGLSAARKRIMSRALVLSLAVILTYRLFIAVAWPFYLGPTSMRDYVSEFCHAFLFGPC
jgi:hypothetical protein